MIRMLVRIGAALAFVGWFLVLRPQALGGPAGWIVVAGDSMRPTIAPGSLVIVQSRPEYRVGDVVAYRVPEGNPGAGDNVIHRIVGGSPEEGFIVRGDNTSGPDIWRPRPADVVGSAWLTVPDAAFLLLFLRSPIVIATVVASLATYAVLGMLEPANAAGTPAGRDARPDRRARSGGPGRPARLRRPAHLWRRPAPEGWRRPAPEGWRAPTPDPF